MQQFIKVLTVDENSATESGWQKLDSEPTVYTNTIEGKYTAICPEGQEGDPVTKIVPVGTVSAASVEAANILAQSKAETDAKAGLVCTPKEPTTYTNDKEGKFTAVCPAGTTGVPVTEIVGIGTVTSLISVEDANIQAQLQSKTMAESKLNCVSLAQVANTIRQSVTLLCPTGTTGDPVTKVREIGTVFADTVEHANIKALQEAQVEAQAALHCVSSGERVERFYNTEQSFTATAPAGYIASSVTKTVAANMLISEDSQEIVDAKALRFVTLQAKANVYRQMEQSDPTVSGGWNGSWAIGSMVKDSHTVTLNTPLKSVALNNKVIVMFKDYRKIGPGGAWPYPSTNSIYDTISQLGTRGEPVGKYAGVIEDGRVHRLEDTNTWPIYDTKWAPYMSYVTAHSLVGTVTGISGGGLTLTLDKASQATVSNVKIYIDNTDKFNQALEANETVTIPAGKFRVSWTVAEEIHGNRINKEIAGSGQDATFIQSPEGCSSVSIQMNNYHNTGRKPKIHDLTIIGNFGDDGYRLLEDDADGFRITDSGVIDNPFILNKALEMSSYNGEVYNVRIIDGLAYNFEIVGKGIKLHDCESAQTVGDSGYSGWGGIHGGADNSSGEVLPLNAKNFVFHSPKLVRGIEFTKCQNTTYESFESFNGAVALNGANDSVCKDGDVYITGDGENPVFNTSPGFIANGLQESSSKNIVQDMRVMQVGYAGDPGYHGLPKLLRSFNGFEVNNIDWIRCRLVRPDMEEIPFDDDYISNAVAGILTDANNNTVRDCFAWGSYPELYHRPDQRNPHVGSINLTGGDGTGLVENCAGGDEYGNGGILRREPAVVAINNHFTTMD